MGDNDSVETVGIPSLVLPPEDRGNNEENRSLTDTDTLDKVTPARDSKLPKPESADEIPLGADEVLSTQPNIAGALAEFMEGMTPYSHLLPEPMIAKMDYLQRISRALERQQKGSEEKPADIRRPSDDWSSCDVRKESMKNWHKTLAHPPQRPWPVIMAFHGNFIEISGTAIMNQDADSSLQRVVIYSRILGTELERITSLDLGMMPIIPPPFKAGTTTIMFEVRELTLQQLLLQFLPQIEGTLADLSEKLDKLETGKAKNGDSSDTVTRTPDAGASGSIPSESINDENPNAAAETGTADNRKDTKQLEDEKEQQESHLRLRISHLKCLRDFVYSDLQQPLELRGKVEDGTLKTISFQNLWHLFKPGDMVVSDRQHSTKLYKVYSVTGGQRQARAWQQEDDKEPFVKATDAETAFDDEEGSGETILRHHFGGIGVWTVFKLDMYSMESNGRMVGPRDILKKINYYPGEMAISDLVVYPVRFHPDRTDLLRRLEERGRKYLKSYGHKSYDGLTAPMSEDYQREDLHGDVFVDPQADVQRRRSLSQQLGRLMPSLRDGTVNSEMMEFDGVSYFYHFVNDAVDIQMMETFMLSTRATLDLMTPEKALENPECLQLMPRTVRGYAFRSRKWCRLDVEFLSDIEKGREIRDSNFDDLVIPPSFRKLLVGLVEHHTSTVQRRQAKKSSAAMGHDSTQLDLVRGKGEGLIILLHGPPGSGKTSTAETIAAYTRRPLYSITCGDLGLKPDALERALSEHTERADKWGCVMLLDEADVFLMQRTWKDLERNALVSVLLRQLEYYSGILFLTTNQPGVIDEAFLSRIHISLRYPVIDLDATKRMWTNIMNRIERENGYSQIKVKFDRDILLEFAEKHFKRRAKTQTTWNGRQIRNAFQNAVALGISQRMEMLGKEGITPEQALESGQSRLKEIRLTRANMRIIARTVGAFEDYMKHLRGNDRDLARENQFRDDDYDAAEPRAVKTYRRPKSTTKPSISTGKAKKGYSPNQRHGHETAVSEEQSDTSVSSSDDDSEGE